MDREHRQKIYTLLRSYYPNAKPLRDPTTLTAWGLILERFPYGDVKNAVLDHVAAGHRFCPDITELTAVLRPEVSMSSKRDEMARRLAATPEAVAQWQTVDRYTEALHRELGRLGLSPFRGSDMTEYADWRRTCEDAGIDFDALLRYAFFGREGEQHGQGE